MTLKAVGFDIDGTLYPDWRAHYRSIPLFLKNIRTIMAFARTRARMRREADQVHMAADPDEAEVRIFAEELGIDVREARTIRDRTIYGEWDKTFRKVKPYPHVRESLLRLKNAGLGLAALSDFPVGRKLEYFGLEGVFDVVIGYPDSLRLKPRPEPFQEMARRMGLKPGEMLYVGNKLDYDVYGSQNAGLQGALIGAPGKNAPSHVTVFRNYPHLADSVLSEVTP